jgi:hypothetical protein
VWKMFHENMIIMHTPINNAHSNKKTYNFQIGTRYMINVVQDNCESVTRAKGRQIKILVEVAKGLT